MPTTRRRRLQGVRVSLSEACRHYLQTGEYGGHRFGTWFDAFQLAGQVLRRVAQGDALPAELHEFCEEITQAHLAETPGTRPFCWWVSAAPAPRACAGLPPDLIRPPLLWRLYFGRPFEDWMLKAGTVLSLESQSHYLRRHNLLEPGERRRIPLAAFEPEEIVITDDTDDEPHHKEEERP